MKSILAYYRDTPAATQAIVALNEAHIETDQISVSGITGDSRRPLRVETKVGDIRGSQYGTLIGCVVGGICAALAHTGVIVDPGIGFIADTALVTALRFLLMGAGIGALTGYLAGLAIWRIVIQTPEGVEGLVLQISASERRLAQLTELIDGTGAHRVEVSDLAAGRAS